MFGVVSTFVKSEEMGRSFGLYIVNQGNRVVASMAKILTCSMAEGTEDGRRLGTLISQK